MVIVDPSYDHWQASHFLSITQQTNTLTARTVVLQSAWSVTQAREADWVLAQLC